jgi:uncharacterized protein YcbX
MPVTIQSFHIYPVKSCQGIEYEQIELTRTGFKYDRHWMLVDKQGRFLSQRKFPDMARIQTRLTDDSLIVSGDDYAELIVPLESTSRNRLAVSIWDDHCSAALVSTAASHWFSSFLNHDCDLVFLPPNEPRLVNPEYAHSKQTVGFADGFPLLILSRASIDLLSDKLGETIDIKRFRPNIVVDGCEAHEEDNWSAISVNNIDIDLVKPCSRCVIPSIDQDTAEPHPSLLKTLASYRRREGKVFVGQNGIHRSTGILTRGQPVATRSK